MSTALTKYISYFFLFILLVLFITFLYGGITNRIPVSLDYNVEIAKTIMNGSFLHLNSRDVYIYFPGSSHIFLTPFLLMGFPNLFGLSSWVILFIACKKLGDTFGLKPSMSIIYAAAICTTISVVRTIGDQSIDKWLCSWFVFSLLLLEKPQKTWKFSLLIGLTLGMLVGTKYSGPLFFIALLAVYGKSLLMSFSQLRFIVSFLIFTVTGSFWYIRNFALTGSPYYPANLPFFPQHAYFSQQDWMLWKVLLFYPRGIPDLINAFLSEYLVWAFSGFLLIGFLIYHFRRKIHIDERIIRLSLLGLTTGIVVLFLPITTPYKIPIFHTISDMRYIYILIAVLMLAVFIIADKFKKNFLLATVALFNAFPVFGFISYLPKIYLLCILLTVLIYWRWKFLVEKSYKK